MQTYWLPVVSRLESELSAAGPLQESDDLNQARAWKSDIDLVLRQCQSIGVVFESSSTSKADEAQEWESAFETDPLDRLDGSLPPSSEMSEEDESEAGLLPSAASSSDSPSVTSSLSPALRRGTCPAQMASVLPYVSMYLHSLSA
jgi:hypothetical protein